MPFIWIIFVTGIGIIFGVENLFPNKFIIKKKVRIAVVGGISMTSLMFCISGSLSLGIRICCMLIAFVIPIILYDSIQYFLKAACSNEGERLLMELTSQYAYNNHNINLTIERTIASLNGCKRSKELLYALSLKLKVVCSDKDLNQALVEFEKNYDTIWSKVLMLNIYHAIHDGINIQTGLNSILTDLKHLKQIAEQERRMNSESMLIAKYLIPGLYLFSILASIFYFGFTWSKFVSYQVETVTGAKYFILIIFLMLFNWILVLFIERKKYDFF